MGASCVLIAYFGQMDIDGMKRRQKWNAKSKMLNEFQSDLIVFGRNQVYMWDEQWATTSISNYAYQRENKRNVYGTNPRPNNHSNKTFYYEGERILLASESVEEPLLRYRKRYLYIRCSGCGKCTYNAIYTKQLLR